YNPFSTLNLFRKKQFIDYWFESGTPGFLIEQIKQRGDIKLVAEDFVLPSNAFDAFDINTIDTKLLLFQTGYLTVKKVSKSPFSLRQEYILGIPNEEVRNGLMTWLLAAYSENHISDVSQAGVDMMTQLFNGDSTMFNISLKQLLSRIPYQLHVPNEAYYHSLFLAWLGLLGFKVEAEIPTNIGRIDAVWTWNERVVIAECKYSATETAETLIEQAFAQIREKKYAERYEGDNKRIALLAVVFAGKKVESRMVELEA
ncbi:MAG: PD-(D/E)XK nuclease domain-containing protein, partial [Paludibacter sp.]|nr:PD-(D/E)XK nuclease domain-containing protein [Paludibacter sp.]